MIPKKFGFILVAVAIFAASCISFLVLTEHSSADPSGVCGDDLSWTYCTDEHALKISGSGQMSDWPTGQAPWYSYRSEIESIILPDGLTSIGSYAFVDCRMESLTIPNSVTSIGSMSFYGCAKLNSLVIGTGVTSISDSSFSNTPTFIKIHDYSGMQIKAGQYGLSASATVYHYDRAGDELWALYYNYSLIITGSGSMINWGNADDVPWCEHVQNITSITLPNGLTTIGDNAFGSCVSLKRIDIPASVVSIGNYAFSGCISLDYVNFPSSVESIGNYAFSRCGKLTSVEIPESVSRIGDYAFLNCYTLNYVMVLSSQLSSLGKSIFKDCISLREIYANANLDYTLPDYGLEGGNLISVYKVGSCCSLWYFYIKESESLYLIGSGQMPNWSSQNDVPWTAEGLNFYCTSISLPDGLTAIGDFAFSGFSEVQTVTVGNDVKYIGSHAFYDCKKLSSIAITDSVTFVGSYAFADCIGLTEVNIDSMYLTEISEHTFDGCTALKSVSIPYTVKSIGTMAFRNCSGLTSVTMNSGASNKEGLEEIGVRAFSGCTALTALTIPSSVKHIGAEAFLDVFTDADPDDGPEAEGAITNFTHLYDYSKLNIWMNRGFYGLNAVSTQFVNYYEAGDNIWCVIYIDLSNCRCSCKLSIDASNVIGGSKDMYDWKDAEDVPWNAYRSLVSTIELTGITSIGGYAFSGFTALTSVDMPNSVKSIGDHAFSECVNLESVKMPNSVKSIGDHAFSGCTALASVSLNNNLKTVGGYVFFGCTALSSIVLPNTVTSIGSYVFGGCSGLTSVTLGYSVETVGDHAFWYCSTLPSLELPHSIYSIGADAFYGCGQLMTVYDYSRQGVSPGQYGLSGSATVNHLDMIGDDLWFYFEDGVLTIMGDGPMYSMDADKFPWNNYREKVFALNLPNGITSLSSYAFSGMSITSVDIPSSVISIGKNTFTGSQISLVLDRTVSGIIPDEVGLPKGVNILRFNDISGIGGNLRFDFKDGELVITGSGDMISWSRADEVPWYYVRDRITSVTLPEGLTSIGSYAFCGCGMRTISIFKSVNSVGDNAFSNCGSLKFILNYNKSLGLSNTGYGSATECKVGTAGEDAGYCRDDENSLLIIFGTGRMYEWKYYDRCPWNQSSFFKYHNLKVLEGITFISRYSFTGDESSTDCKYDVSCLESVSLPDSLEELGAYCFRETPIASIVIPDNVKKIPDHAFYNCYNLSSVTIGSSVTEINALAFYDDSRLCEVYNHSNLMIVPGKYEIPSKAKIVCDGGDDVKCTYQNGTFTISGTGPMYDGYCAVMPWHDMALKANTLIIEEGVTHIGYKAFVNCKNITSVTFPSTLVSIGDSAFQDCTNLRGSITIPRSVLSVGSYAFFCCSNITSVSFEGADTAIGSWAFAGCLHLSEVELPGFIQCISESAFNSCLYLKTLTLPDTVVSIGRCAFYSTTIQSLVIPDSVIYIGDYAFCSCELLENVVLSDSLEYIGDYAFRGFRASCIIVPSSVLAVGEHAFDSSDDRSITIYNHSDADIDTDGYRSKVTVINCDRAGEDLRFIYMDGVLTFYGTGKMYNWESPGKVPWSGCRADIRKVILPDGLVSIGDYAFFGCTALGSAGIPSSVMTIGNYAFSDCSSLTGLSLPYGLTSIGCHTFDGCTALRTVYIPSSVTVIGDHAFLGCTALTHLSLSGPELRICGYAFSDCGLKTLTISCRVLVLEDCSLSLSVNLTTLIISSSDVTIGDYALAKCRSLSALSIIGSRITFGNYVFDDCTSLLSLTVPDSEVSFSAFTFIGSSISMIYDRTSMNMLPGQYGLGSDAVIIHEGINTDMTIGTSTVRCTMIAYFHRGLCEIMYFLFLGAQPPFPSQNVLSSVWSLSGP